MSRLEEWTDRVVRELGLPEQLAGTDVRDLVLDLARDAAHGVARPAAPLTTFLVGVAAGRSGAGPAELRELADRVVALVPPPDDADPA